MQKIAAKDLKAGMSYDQPIFIDPYNILADTRADISEEDLTRLANLGVQEVYTFGQPFDKNGMRARKKAASMSLPTNALDIAVGLGSASSDEEQITQILANKEVSAKTVEAQYLEFRKRRRNFMELMTHTSKILQQCFQNLTQKKEIMQAALITCSQQLTNEILTAPMHVICFQHRNMGANAVLHHILHVAAYSVIVARGLNIKYKQIQQISFGMLFMDIGMLAIPSHVRDKTSPLENQEEKLMRTHTILGYRLLENMKQIQKLVSIIALQHHETFDGSGYPHGLKGNQIDPIASLANVCDTYTAMIEKRPYRDAHLPALALRKMLAATNMKRYNPKIINALVRQISFFPIGSLLKLSNKSIALVVGTNPQNPKCPVVRLLRHPDGHRLSRLEFVDLSAHEKLKIVDAISARAAQIELMSEL